MTTRDAQLIENLFKEMKLAVPEIVAKIKQREEIANQIRKDGVVLF